MRRLAAALLALALALLLAAPSRAAGAKLENEDQKVSYALGLAIAQNLEQFALTAAELDLVVAGMREGLGGKAQVDANAYRQKIQQLAQELFRQDQMMLTLLGPSPTPKDAFENCLYSHP